MKVTTRFPVVEVDRTLVVLAFGDRDASFGDEVSVDAAVDNTKIDGMFVAAVDTAPISEFAPEVLALFGFDSPTALLHALERAYGTGFALSQPITIYTLIDTPVEASA